MVLHAFEPSISAAERLDSSKPMLKLSGLDLAPIWLDPDHTVRSGQILMQGYGISALTIARSGQIIGFVAAADLAVAPPGNRLADYAKPCPHTLSGSLSIRQAAAALIRDDLTMAPVVEGDRFLGVVTSNMLLKELGRSWDPLTGLGWTDHLREWGVAQLDQGREISVIAFDVDCLSAVNDRFGHDRGDRILQLIANELSSAVDPVLDVAIRFGGDEFVVACLRSHSDAEVLARKLAGMIESELAKAGENIGLSFGLSGGFRTHERPATHPAATLDDLIRLAFDDLAARKRPVHAQAIVDSSSNSGHLKLVGVEASFDGPARMRASIEYQGAVLEGVDGKPETGMVQASADSTARAIEAAVKSSRIVLDPIQAYTAPDRTKLVAVTGTLWLGQDRFRLAATVDKESDGAIAAAKAVVEAVNSVLQDSI